MVDSLQPYGLKPSRFRSFRASEGFRGTGPSVRGISQTRYWSGLPFPSPGDLPNARIEPGSPTLQADSLLSVLPGEPKKPGSHGQEMF